MIKWIVKTRVSECTYDELCIAYRNLVSRAKDQVLKAYSPYSEFNVGAAVLLANDEVFSASNQENVAYPSGICAERNAVFYANAQYPDVPIKAIAIAAHTEGNFLQRPITPCGACRQVLLESENRGGENMTIILYGRDVIQVIESAQSLLPLSFKLVTQ